MFNLLVLALLSGFVAVAPSSIEAASSDLVELVTNLPSGVRAFLAGTAQLLTVVVPVAIVAYSLWQRRFRELLLVASSAVTAWIAVALIEGWFGRVEPSETLNTYEFESWLTDASFPSVVYLAALTAAITAASPLFGRAWRRAGWVAIAAAVLVRMLTGTQAPVSLLLTVVVGTAAASLVLIIMGAPARRPGTDELKDAARRTGIHLDRLEPLQRVGGEGRWFRGVATDDTVVAVKYLDGDERDADLLFRLWRSIRVKGIEDTRTAVSPDAAVSHEAMVTMLAASAGVDTVDVLGVAETDRGAVLISTLAPGELLAELPAEAITDEVLSAVWEQIQTMHDQRIAHRQLDAHHLALHGAGASVLRFRWSTPAASDELLAIDVADLLTATGALVGADRAVAAAEAVLGSDPLVEALPYLQPLALASANKKAARADKQLLSELHELVIADTGADDVEMAELERIGVKRIIGVFGFGVLALFLLGLVSNWDQIVDVFSQANLADVPVMIVLILLTNVAGAASLIGAVTKQLPLGDTTIVMFGQSFLNRFTPANAGGMAMRIRYLQKGGTDLTLGTAAVGLTSVASGIVQTVFLVGFTAWAGSVDTGIEPESPPWDTIAVVVLLIVACVVFVFAIPKLRKAVLQVVRRFTDKIRDEFGELLRRPGKLTLLFGGATVSKLLTISTFIIACRAFDIDIGGAQLASAYMVATTIASAVPTPGGVGAVEAALVLVLQGLGVDEAVAWSATLLFRLISYWMPIIPGAIGLKWSERRDLV